MKKYFRPLNFRRNVSAGLSVALILISAYMLLAPVTFADADIISAVMIFRRNVLAGLSVALILISAYMLLAPVTFADADIISAVAP